MTLLTLDTKGPHDYQYENTTSEGNGAFCLGKPTVWALFLLPPYYNSLLRLVSAILGKSLRILDPVNCANGSVGRKEYHNEHPLTGTFY